VTGTLSLGSSVTDFKPKASVTVTGSLVLEASSVVVIADEQTLTVGAEAAISGDGVIKAVAGTSGGIDIGGVLYTTTATGVAGSALAAAAEAIAAETALVDVETLDLQTAFGTLESTLGIDSVAIGSSSATAVQNTPDAQTNTTVEVGSGIFLAGVLTPTSFFGTDYEELNDDPFTLSLETITQVSITDGGSYSANVTKYAVFKFTKVKLQHGELIGPELKAFHIGVETGRAS
jgi:hypothetical protein